jgi:hypothetical protein
MDILYRSYREGCLTPSWKEADIVPIPKLDRHCTSEWKNVPAGVPQGTKLGPWLFVLMIDDRHRSYEHRFMEIRG